MGNILSGNLGFGLTPRRDLELVLDHRKIPEAKFMNTAEVIAPPIAVTERMANMPSFYAGQGDRYITGERTEEGGYPLLTTKLSEAYYNTKGRGWEMKQDIVEDTENDELLDLQKEHTKQLGDTSSLYKEYRAAKAVELTSAFATTNKKNITAEANNWFTDDNMRNDIKSQLDLSTLYTVFGLELEFLTLIVPVTFLREIIKISLLVDSVGLTSESINLSSLEKKAQYLTNFIGCKNVLPVSGKINTANFETADGKPKFERLWSSSIATLTYLSEGGASWGPGLARQPWSKKHLKGKRDYMESYAIPQYDQTRIRMKNFDGLYIDYAYAIQYKGINYTD